MVSYVRRTLGMRRVGHTGTLDPAASGLLLIAVGRATRLIRFLPDGPKIYVGTLALGVRTDSDDLTGTVLDRHDGDLPGPFAVREAAAKLTGRTLQTPPAVSAKKIDGQRAYRLARQGKEVRTRPVEVVVERFDIEPVAGQDGIFEFVAAVSAGTYIRALARDLGQALGCGGALATLRRTAIGPLSVDHAFAPGPLRIPTPPDDALAGRVVPIDKLPLTPPELVLSEASDVVRFVHGVGVEIAPDPGSGTRTVRDLDGRLLGVADLDHGTARPMVVLPHP